MYGITADELHERIVDAMGRYYEYMGYEWAANYIRAEHNRHPLEQVLLTIDYHDRSKLAARIRELEAKVEAVKCKSGGG